MRRRIIALVAHELIGPHPDDLYYRTLALLTQEEQLNVLGSLNTILFEIFLNLLAPSQGRAFFCRRSAPHPAGSLRTKRRAGLFSTRFHKKHTPTPILRNYEIANTFHRKIDAKSTPLFIHFAYGYS